MGELSVLRGLAPTLLIDVREVALHDDPLMSSLFTVAEITSGTRSGESCNTVYIATTTA